jgi:hypothetical protein
MPQGASIDGVKTEFIGSQGHDVRFEPGQLPPGSTVDRHVTVAPLLSSREQGAAIGNGPVQFAGLNVETSSGKSGKA